MNLFFSYYDKREKSYSLNKSYFKLKSTHKRKFCVRKGNQTMSRIREQEEKIYLKKQQNGILFLFFFLKEHSREKDTVKHFLQKGILDSV